MAVEETFAAGYEKALEDAKSRIRNAAEDQATRSRDFGRGYMAAIPVIEELKKEFSNAG